MFRNAGTESLIPLARLLLLADALLGFGDTERDKIEFLPFVHIKWTSSMLVPSAQGTTGHRLEGDASHKKGFPGPGLTCEEVCAPRGDPRRL